jgi:hypothetical protein
MGRPVDAAPPETDDNSWQVLSFGSPIRRARATTTAMLALRNCSTLGDLNEAAGAAADGQPGDS